MEKEYAEVEQRGWPAVHQQMALGQMPAAADDEHGRILTQPVDLAAGLAEPISADGVAKVGALDDVLHVGAQESSKSAMKACTGAFRAR